MTTSTQASAIRPRDAVKTPLSRREHTRLMSTVSYVGHATVMVEVDGVRLLTDPLLRRRVAHLRRAVGLDIDALGSPDAVLVSHAHHDHLDLPSLERLGRSVLIVVPRGLGRLLHRRGFESLVEVEKGDELAVGSVTVQATHAEHDGRRRPGRGEGPALGYAILGSRRVYFTGDTGLFPGMDGLVSDLDLALVPIWGWGAKLGRGTHLDPASAAEALRLLRPRAAVPIHWGTYLPLHRGLRAAPTFLSEPAELFVRAAAIAAPGVRVHVLPPGGTLSF
jgi:L-ascorbate metabolism protein UlaG (beta-lactamase superfamily)